MRSDTTKCRQNWSATSDLRRTLAARRARWYAAFRDRYDAALLERSALPPPTLPPPLRRPLPPAGSPSCCESSPAGDSAKHSLKSRSTSVGRFALAHADMAAFTMSSVTRGSRHDLYIIGAAASPSGLTGAAANVGANGGSARAARRRVSSRCCKSSSRRRACCQRGTAVGLRP